MMCEPDGKEHELNRLDIKNRSPLPPDAETAIIEQMRAILPQVQGVLIVDQVQERNCGVITDRVRAEIQLLARENPAKFFIADSRERAGMFRDVILKTNLGEAIKAAGKAGQFSEDHPEIVEECCRVLFSQTHHPVIVTRGEAGCAFFLEPDSPLVEIQAVPVEDPVDIVGAGDSFLAAVGASLCAGANLEEAVLIGNLAASIVIQQIGTTGTASRAQIIERFRGFKNLST
jgi:bifunctional ADP-heptose synthase (sugar kinase/adenylyltransferase)